MTEKKTTATLKASTAPKVKGVKRYNDATLGWVKREYPQLETWRALAVEWMKGETRGVAARLAALVAFLERYLVQQGLPLDPAVFLARSTVLPDFYRTFRPDSRQGIEYNNAIHAFLLAAGANFGDWQWAQSALGVEIGQAGRSAPDWFEVTEEQIDQNDPDCVWRLRKVRQSYRGGQVLEMWSPVRWVALLVKLIVPLRTFQVRMLDSGEADTRRYSAGGWALNPSRLAQGCERRALQQGVFRRSNPLSDGEEASTVLYINTNKTADIAKSGPEKGYVLPWISGGPVHQDVFYWLEKLRNWQEKYNPVSRRTSWAEMDGRHINAKSEVQLAGYPDACFLFRLPEFGENEWHLPVSEGPMLSGWFRLLESFELRLADRGETHSNGARIRFLPPSEERVKSSLTTLFPLHSLRVSLITALALEGQVPFPILQKLVGHSRLLMTLYYTKPGATHIRDVLLGAAERLEARKESSIQNFLLDTAHEELLQKAICNSVPSLAVAIPQHPAARNPVGWMPMHHGLCLVGGNTSEAENNGVVGGCYNGGASIGSPSAPKYGAVPGGSRNCVRCRWFVTEPHHLPALAAHFNTLAYHFDEARNACLVREQELQGLKKQKADAEDTGHPFDFQGAYRQAERVWESAMKRFSDLAEDVVACWRLIERCKAALEAAQSDGTQLVTVGEVADVQVAFEETESELLQLSGVCDNVEVYPDLQPGKAVFRRSQLLDAVLYRDDLPPVFMLLSEQEQLLAGNAFMRRLAQQMNPANPALGQREVVRLMDAGVRLSHHFNIDLASLLHADSPVQSFPIGPRTLTGDEV